jgi:hypothetical protein
MSVDAIGAPESMERKLLKGKASLFFFLALL